MNFKLQSFNFYNFIKVKQYKLYHIINIIYSSHSYSISFYTSLPLKNDDNFIKN
jgi:hypothetical protein